VPVWIRSPSEASERCPTLPLDALTGGPHGAAWAFLPLVADDELNGVLTLVFDEDQPFDGPTRAFLAEVAAACGSALARGSLFTRTRARAIASEEARAAGEVHQRRSEQQLEDRTHLYERERFARSRAEAETVVAVRAADDLEHAKRLTTALYLAATPEDVAAALVNHGVEGFGAVGLELTRQGAGGVLETVATAGSPPQGDAAEQPARGGAATAEAEVFRTGAPLWLDPGELARRFPGSSQALLARGAGSWLGVPVPSDDHIDAVLSVSFPRERAFTRDDRARLALLADECASALSRTAHGAAARAAGAQPADAFVVQYDETGMDGPVARVLGVFSSESSARDALRELERTRSLLVHASITSWTLDVPRPRTRVELDLE
jgi:GAF domain-containing protein